MRADRQVTHVEHGGGGDTRGLQLRRCILGGPFPCPRRKCVARRCRVGRTPEQRGGSVRLVRVDRDSYPSLGHAALERALDEGHGIVVAGTLRVLLSERCPCERHEQVEGVGLVHGEIDVLALARQPPPQQRGTDGEGGVEAGGAVGEELPARPDRWLVGEPVMRA